MGGQGGLLLKNPPWYASSRGLVGIIKIKTHDISCTRIIESLTNIGLLSTKVMRLWYAFFKRGAIASVSSMWACYVHDIYVGNIPRPADESAKFQNKPAARGSLTNGRLAKGEMLGAGSGDDPLYTGLWAQPAHRRCHPRYIVGLLHYASWTETDNSKRHVIIVLFLQRQFFICHYNLIQLTLARPLRIQQR